MLEGRVAEFGALRALARKLDVSPSLVTRWKRGDQKPLTGIRVKLESEFGIPIGDWDVPAEPIEVAS